MMMRTATTASPPTRALYLSRNILYCQIFFPTKTAPLSRPAEKNEVGSSTTRDPQARGASQRPTPSTDMPLAQNCCLKRILCARHLSFSTVTLSVHGQTPHGTQYPLSTSNPSGPVAFALIETRIDLFFFVYCIMVVYGRLRGGERIYGHKGMIYDKGSIKRRRRRKKEIRRTYLNQERYSLSQDLVQSVTEMTYVIYLVRSRESDILVDFNGCPTVAGRV